MKHLLLALPLALVGCKSITGQSVIEVYIHSSAEVRAISYDFNEGVIACDGAFYAALRSAQDPKIPVYVQQAEEGAILVWSHDPEYRWDGPWGTPLPIEAQEIVRRRLSAAEIEHAELTFELPEPSPEPTPGPLPEP